MIFHLKIQELAFCNHCAANGGAKYTHNTNECRKYDKNGKLNKISNQRPK